ncbi:HipA domain-containing protein [Bradyrhizobium yuanmingense]|uniref:HipA domain-containing protein n=1 Tax=Bradyrhizobium yuanmingense TaxID=108015 RepID=UPI00056B01FD|nr:HipA domain-containing protein [Bradyrhizobium yuanmingense]
MLHLRGTTENESACLRLANHLGITAAEAKVGKFGQEVAIVVTRYDREIDKDGVVRRFHQEDMCQALAAALETPGGTDENGSRRDDRAIGGARREDSRRAQRLREGLKEPVLDTMLDGISARGKAIVQQYLV